MSTSKKEDEIFAAPTPQEEHKWLQQMVGNWTSEIECQMGPDTPPLKQAGKETVESLGGLWIVTKGVNDLRDDSSADCQMTLGFDPEKKRFVGSFVASMMTHLWTYEGELDASKRILTLNTVGPSMAGEDGGLVPYQDLIEFVNEDHRTLRSQTKNEKGEWKEFMVAHYHRQK